MSSPLLVLLRKEVRFATRRPVYWVSSVLIVVFVLWLSIWSTLDPIRETSIVSPELADYMIRLYPQMFLLLQPLSLFLLMSLYLFTELFTMEKALGRMEMLLTSPLRVVHLWLGKCVAIFVLVYPFVLTTTVAYVGLWNYVWRDQVAQPFLLPVAPALVVGLALDPLLAFALISLLGLVTLLVSRSNSVQLAAFFIAFGTTFFGSYALGWVRRRMTTQDSDLVTWPVAGFILALTIVLVGILWLLQRRLDKDRVVRAFA